MIRCEFNLAKIMCVNILRGNYFAKRRHCLVFRRYEFPYDNRDVSVQVCRAMALPVLPIVDLFRHRSSNRTMYTVQYPCFGCNFK